MPLPTRAMSRGENDRQEPGLALDVKVIEDEKERSQDHLDDGNEEEVRDDLGEVEFRAGVGAMRWASMTLWRISRAQA